MEYATRTRAAHNPFCLLAPKARAAAPASAASAACSCTHRRSRHPSISFRVSALWLKMA